MRILHLASSNRWTGAAAPAFAETEALRLAGVDAHYAYVGGYRLEAKIGRLGFTHAAIGRSQNPAAFFRSLRALEALGPFDFVHAHLTYDHLLALFLARRTGARVARTFHSRRVLRRDPFSRALLSRTGLLCAVNEAFQSGDRPVLFTPPPVDRRQFNPDGPDVRALYGFADAPVVVTIGKLAPGRGFELAMRTFAELRRELDAARMMIVGHGPHRPFLEQLAHELRIDDAVAWAGYHEDDLASHFRAADVLLFTAAGSDEGHRAVLEAMACGVPPVVAPIEGVDALLRDLDRPLIAGAFDPSSIATAAFPILIARDRALRAAVAAAAERFGYTDAASRLIDAYRAPG